MKAAVPKPTARTSLRIALIAFGCLPLLGWIPASTPWLGSLSDLLATALGFACQNDPSRALAPLGEAMPVCARCSGLYFGVGLGAALCAPTLRRESLWVWLGFALLLMGLDVATEQLHMRPPYATLRLITGLLVAYPAALLALGIAQTSASAKRRSAMRTV